MKHKVFLQSDAARENLFNYQLSGTEEIMLNDLDDFEQRFRHFQIALTDEILKEIDEEDRRSETNGNH